MPAIRPRDLLSDAFLERVGDYALPPGAAAAAAGLAPGPVGQVSSDAMAGIARDLAKLRDLGYFRAALPAEFGGLGYGPLDTACAQRRLAYYAPMTALAVSAHLYWTGAAADAYRAGDPSARWIMLEAARGAVFAGGHGLPGNDLDLASPLSRCEVAGESGYRFRTPGVLSALTPGWDWMAVHGIATPAGGSPATVLAFAGRGSRCTPAYRIARVLPAGPPADVFATSALGWGLPLLASVQYAMARRAFNTALAAVSRQRGQASGVRHPLDQWPVAEASLRLDGIKAKLDELMYRWVPHAGRQADPGGQQLIKIFTVRHEAEDGARRVVGLASQITESAAALELATGA